MDANDLLCHIRSGEGLMTEFKRCGGAPGSDVFETICSFANRQGGNIFLGVSDKGDIVGVPQGALRNVQRAIVNTVSNHELFNVPPVIETEPIEAEGRFVIRIWVPMGPAVYMFKGVAYDRIADADIKVAGIEQMSLLYLRKQNEYTERRIFRYVTLDDFNPDTISEARRLATKRTPDHPWGSMDDEGLLRSAKLYARDLRTGEEGYTLAAVLLFGTDAAISDVCPAYKTDAIVRRENIDRYDDRLTLTCNLIDAYPKLINFAESNLPDRFAIESGQRVSARDVIVRELVSNLLIHREFISPFPAKLVIERSELRTENASRSIYEGRITLSDFNPISKNPNIAGVFSQIGYAEELGSGMRNLQKYSRTYSGKPAVLEDGDVFRASVPITPVSASKGLDGALEAVAILSTRNGDLTAAALAEYLGVTTRSAQRYIRQMLDKGLVATVEGRPHRYRPL